MIHFAGFHWNPHPENDQAGKYSDQISIHHWARAWFHLSGYWIDPLRDSRWTEFIEHNQSASIFHTPGWLEALRRTYGFGPTVVTTSAPGCPLTNGIVFCRVHSWLTGRRLVSLPFSDHCEPLAEHPDDIPHLLQQVRRCLEPQKYKYFELRPPGTHTGTDDSLSQYHRSEEFYLHTLDLRPSVEELMHSFHKNCVQRKIRRAQKEGLICEAGRSDKLLSTFYHLQVRTRSRQHLPPQPLGWFRNLIGCLGPNMEIRVASTKERPVAAIIAIRHKNTTIYKYGCTDASFHELGGMQMLLWRTIQDARSLGCTSLDMGRSAYDNAGLVAFKDRWGTTKSNMSYFRFPAFPLQDLTSGLMQLVRKSISRMPESLQAATGYLAYKHFA